MATLGSRYDLRYAIAATFATPERAQEVVKNLRTAGYYDVWTGHIIRMRNSEFNADDGAGDQYDVIVEADSWFERLFGEGRKTLHDVLIAQGFRSEDVVQHRLIDGHSTVLTVDGEHDLEHAARIIRTFGGHILSTGYEHVAPLIPGESKLYGKEPPDAVRDPDQLAAAATAGSARR